LLYSHRVSARIRIHRRLNVQNQLPWKKRNRRKPTLKAKGRFSSWLD
jgi:hypothetical protein